MDHDSSSNLSQSVREKYEKDGLPVWFGIIILITLAGIFSGVYFIDDKLPEAKSQDDSSLDVFIAENARKHLDGLVKIGPRVVGSEANEIKAVKYLKERIIEIISGCSNENVEYFTQEVSGQFYLNYQPYGSINVYNNLQNVVVRIGNRKNELNSNAVLINSHFDTMPQSPGGSDDGIMCAVMLEVIRNICKQPVDNTLIFLFNGAEESYLQGSHGFITNENKFNDVVKVLVNLEATGAGGRELLFQAGPQQSWLMNYYSNTPHPHAQVAGEEVFQSGIIPSDTDFRIFRDFGDTIGYDMAYTRNGYRYHTPFDGIDNIDIGTYQHTGDNVLALVRELANAPEVQEPKTQADSPVFFDFFGLFMIHYNETVEITINVITIVLSILVAAKAFYDFKMRFNLFTLKYLSVIFLSILLSWIFGMALAAFIGFFIDVIHSSMTWYRYQILVLAIYVLPTFCCSSGVLLLLNRYFRRKSIRLEDQTQIYSHVSRLWWTLMLIIGTAFRIRSVHIVMMPVLLTSVAYLIVQIIGFFTKRHSTILWIIIYLISTIVPTMFGMYITLEVFGLFIPICGRFGVETNPEFIIGLFAWIVTIFLMSFYEPIICYSRHFVYVIGVMAATFLAFLIAINFINPYNYSYENPRTQRYWIYHTNRIIRADNNSIIKVDSGFTFYNMDRNSPSAVEDYVGVYLDKQEDLSNDCDLALYCGLAVMHVAPVEELEGYVWIPANEAVIRNKPFLNYVRRLKINANTYRYYFTAGGTDHYNIYISPKLNMHMTRTSLVDVIPSNIPTWKDRETYFVLYVDGKERTNLEFSVDISTPDVDYDGKTLDIAIAGTYYNEMENIITEEYQTFLKEFPDWAQVFSWLGTYENWSY